jgi:hypothetical protein
MRRYFIPSTVRVIVSSIRHNINPRQSLVPTGVVFLLGLGVHAIEQALFVRAGPIPIVVTAPLVATLLYLWLRDATRARTLVLLAWGAVSSVIAILAVYLLTVSYELPRALTEVEMVLYDLAMFLWFVLALAAVYAFVARRDGPHFLVALSPVLQAAFSLSLRVLVALGIYA